MQAVTNPVDVPLRPQGQRGQQQILSYVPGILLTGAIALLAMQLSKGAWMQAHGISALTLAIIGGMIVGNTVYPRIAGFSAQGVTFSKQILLRTGIILFGLRLTFQGICQVGAVGGLIHALVFGSTLSLSCLARTRAFRLNRRTAMLIGAGSSICGAAAVMATEPVVRGRADEVCVAVSTVVAFGTLAIFVYPALYHLNDRVHFVSMTPFAYGIFTGSTVHEVAQVVAAGKAVAETAANAAVITKLVRVMMLAPFLVLLSGYLSRNAEDGVAPAPLGTRWRGVIPWFALGFIAVAGFNFMAGVPPAFLGTAIPSRTLLPAPPPAPPRGRTPGSPIRPA